MKNNWDQLYSDSEKLTKATSIHAMFTQEDISFVESRLKCILTKFLKKKDLNAGIKIYVNQELRNNYAEIMAQKQPTNEGSLEEWCHSIFGFEKFGVVFNHLESYDNELTERMSKIINPLLKKAGIPLGGISFLFFMGNYGFTPFGIHKEIKGEEGFLFHMGPSAKTFYTWNIEKYNMIEHNTQVFHNIKEMLPLAKSYELQPKSVMFIPNYLYHIANTEEFSFSIVMDYINPSQEALDNLIAKEIANKKPTTSKKATYLPPISLSDELDSDLIVNNNTWQEKYKQIFQRHVARLKSNRGILLPSIPEVGKYIVNNNFSITGKKAFSLIEFTDSEEQLYVMARGNEIPVSKNVNLSALLEGLNNGNTYSFDELKELLLVNWEIHNLYEFISQLLQFAAIEKVSN